MITRENYEEYFLLYADNELPAETRLAVERFVDAHPDLREEWEAMLQCRFQPETDQQFPDKNSLLQYEDSFLSYIDGELDEEGRKAVETLVRQDEPRGRELKQLMMTVSQPDMTVVFPDKESLYRTEKRRRVVMMPWLRAGVAAAVLAAVALLVFTRGHNHENMPAVAGSGQVKTGGAATSQDATASASAATSGAAGTPGSGVAADTSAGTVHSTTASIAKNNSAVVTSNHSPALHSTKDAVEIRHDHKGRTPETPQTTNMVQTPVIAETGMKSDTSDRSSKMAAIAPAHPDKAALPVTTAVAVNIPKEQSSFATQALLKESQEDGAGDMADNMQQPAGKTKLRGLFRKVTRAFGKTADRDDDGQRQVLISAFQVALK